MNKKVKYTPVFFLFLIALLSFRIILGAQINFSHVDFEQIYCIGLEHAFSDEWPFWGPDVIWSKTRLPGAMQSFLAGTPIKWTNLATSPLILANLISFLGLFILGEYLLKRAKNLNPYLVHSLLLLMPFTLYNGTTLLNTTYLVFSGSILSISVMELFVYRKNRITDSRYLFFGLGFCLFFTYQLHLTWVMFIPYLAVLFYLEFMKSRRGSAQMFLFFILGCILSASTVIPTFWVYGQHILEGNEGNLNFSPTKLLSFPDFLLRYLSSSTTDIQEKTVYFDNFSQESTWYTIFIWIQKLIPIILIPLIFIGTYLSLKNRTYLRLIIVLLLSALLATALYSLSNKHLSIRTYILIFAFPQILLILVLNDFWKLKKIRFISYSALCLSFLFACSTLALNFHGPYSFKAHNKKINRALEKQDYEEFAKRRVSVMDDL